jgi:hypothetical protein
MIAIEVVSRNKPRGIYIFSLHRHQAAYSFRHAAREGEDCIAASHRC